MCRSRRELSNAYLLAKFRFDTAENEPSKVCRIPSIQVRAARGAAARGRDARRRGRGRRVEGRRALVPAGPGGREGSKKKESRPRNPGQVEVGSNTDVGFFRSNTYFRRNES